MDGCVHVRGSSTLSDAETPSPGRCWATCLFDGETDLCTMSPDCIIMIMWRANGKLYEDKCCLQEEKNTPKSYNSEPWKIHAGTIYYSWLFIERAFLAVFAFVGVIQYTINLQMRAINSVTASIYSILIMYHVFFRLINHQRWMKTCCLMSVLPKWQNAHLFWIYYFYDEQEHVRIWYFWGDILFWCHKESEMTILKSKL